MDRPMRVFGAIVWAAGSCLATGQPMGTFRVDNAAANKNTSETSAGAAWVGSPATLHVVCAWNDERSGQHLGVAVTTDGFATRCEYAPTGGSSQTPCGGSIKPILNLPSGNPSAFEFDPMTAVDPLSGDLYVGGIWGTVLQNAESGIFVARKPANQTQEPHFTQIVNVIRDPSNPSIDFPINTADKPWMAVGRRHDNLNATRVFVAFNTYEDNSFLDPGPNISWSDDQGLTWSTPTKITLPADVSSASKITGPLPRVGPDGKLYVSMYDAEEGRILLQRSTDGGATWLASSGPGSVKVIASLMDFWLPGDNNAGQARLPGNPQRLGPWPCIAVDPVEGNKLYCMFIDTTRVLQTYPPTPGLEEWDLDIYFSKSTDYGDTWTTPVKKSTLGVTDQFFPWVEVDASGRIHLAAYDTRQVDNDPPQGDSSLEGRFNNYYRISSNGGATWTETRMTSPSCVLPLCGAFIAFNDYAGMALAGQTAIPIFTTVNPNDPQQDPNCPVGNGDILGRVFAP